MKIQVPNIDYSVPTEKVLLEGLSVLRKLKGINESCVLDFSNIEKIHPFLLSFIAFYLKSIGKEFILENVSNNIASLIQKTAFIGEEKIKEDTIPEQFLSKYSDSDYLPICHFERNYSYLDELESKLKKQLFCQLESFVLSNDFKTAIAYLISELLDNIKEHSLASHGFLYMDHSDEKNLYIIIADDGISILGSYLNQPNPDPRIMVGINNILSLEYSLNGVSTKNNRETFRGYGLSTNLDIVTNGLKGEFILISGDSLFLRKNDEDTKIDLPQDAGWEGTIIMVKIPLGKHEEFKYLNYIE